MIAPFDPVTSTPDSATFWARNDGTGQLTSETSLPLGNTAYSTLHLLDADGDGNLDLHVAGVAEHRLLMGDGTGNFVDETNTRLLSATSAPGVLAVGDIDGDGDLDLINGGGLLVPIQVVRNLGGVFLADPLATPGMPFAQRGELANLDSDGDLDLLTHGGGVRRFDNDGTGVFLEATSRISFALGPGNDVTGQVVGDFDADGAMDFIAVTGFEARFFAGLPSGGHVEQAGRMPAGSTAVSLAALDLDADGDLDLVGTTNSSPILGQLFVNDGTGSFALTTTDLLGHQPHLADFDNDGDIDVFNGRLLRNRSRQLSLQTPAMLGQDARLMITSPPSTSPDFALLAFDTSRLPRPRDTWEYDRGVWLRALPGGTAPRPRSNVDSRRLLSGQ